MVPEPYRIINRAIALLPDEYQDEREAARAALHQLFNDWIREGNGPPVVDVPPWEDS